MTNGCHEYVLFSCLDFNRANHNPWGESKIHEKAVTFSQGEASQSRIRYHSEVHP